MSDKFFMTKYIVRESFSLNMGSSYCMIMTQKVLELRKLQTPSTFATKTSFLAGIASLSMQMANTNSDDKRENNFIHVAVETKRNLTVKRANP